jgi:hypothetical protein
MILKSLRKFGGVGKQPLRIVAASIVLIGLVAALLSWNAPNRALPLFNSDRPQPGSALGVTSSNGLNQNSRGEAINPQATNPTTQNPTPSPVNSNPAALPASIPPIFTQPPIKPPCNSCTPLAGHVCPMYVIYPCYNCGGSAQIEVLCETE